MRATAITTLAGLEALESPWWDLWRRSPSATPFQSPAWLIPWWRHYHPGELRAVAVWETERLMGLAPLYLEDGALGRRLLPIGISLSDYLDVLLDPDCADDAAVALAMALEDEPGWDACELEELAPGAAAFALPGIRGSVEVLIEQSLCPVLSLHPQRLALSIPSRQRRHLNLAMNRAARRGGVATVRVTGVDLGSAFNHLLRLHGLRWTSRGECGVLASGPVQGFQREVVPRLHTAGLLRFYLLSIEGAVVAAHYGFLHRARAYAYLTGFDPDYAFESPGTLLLAHAIEQAIAEGARELHFLRGREEYKYSWGGIDRVNRKRSFRRMAAERSVA